MSNQKRGFVDFKAVKTNVSMQQILDHYQLTPTFRRSQDSESLTGPCPLHGGENPNQFKVSLNKNIWNCFGECKRGGNVLDFISKKEGCSIRDAAIHAAQWFNLPRALSYGEVEALAQVPPSTESPSEHLGLRNTSPSKEDDATQNKPLGFRLTSIDPTHPYLRERGLVNETIIDFGLGYCSKGSMVGRIAIPICNPDGQVVAYAGRWPGEPPGETSKYKFPAGFRKSLELFNIDRAKAESNDSPLVLVEGFFDAIRLWQAGIKKVVALMGSTLSSAQERMLLDSMPDTERFVLVLDEDDAGRAGREAALLRLSQRRFVKLFCFENEGQQPEDLTAEQLDALRI